MKLQVHYHSETARLWRLQKKLEKDIRTAKAITQEFMRETEETERGTKTTIKEQEKKLDKTQPKR